MSQFTSYKTENGERQPKPNFKMVKWRCMAQIVRFAFKIDRQVHGASSEPIL